MGIKNEKGENMEWTVQNTKVLIEIIYDRVKKRQLQGSTFKTTIWEEINGELKKITGESYGIDRLKGKFNRLRLQHRQFSTLLCRTGVTWDAESNKVNAPEEVWEDLYKQGKFYKQFKKNGFEHDYDILGEIFNSSTTTGKLSQASTQEPPTSDEERQMEGNFLSKGVHIDVDVDVVDEDNTQELDKKRKSISSSIERQRKESRSSRLEKLDAALSQWAESMSVRTEASKAKIEASKARAERYKAQANQATSSLTDPYSIDACMELLNSMEDIPSTIYNNALEKFKDEDWRLMFIKMPSFRRKDSLASLE